MSVSPKISDVADMTKAERDRYFAGRLDWRDSDWEDHCGDPNCESCRGYIPYIDARLAALRARADQSGAA